MGSRPWFRVQQADRSLAAGALDVVWVGQGAAVQREAPASDAVGELIAELLKRTDSIIKFCLPALGELLPVSAGGRSALWQTLKGLPYPCQWDAYPLCDPDHSDAPQGLPAISALVAGSAAAGDESLPLIEVHRRDGDPAARGHVPDAEAGLVPLWHVSHVVRLFIGDPVLTSTLVEVT